MDDTCVVCAETLEWAAYGQCGHREVCSTCTSRLRFICNDRRCCLCKSECSIIFVTKDLGEYTKMISDFSIFPANSTEGQVGQYWYHERTQAFFDDLDHYKMIKAICRLCCIVCEKMDDQGNKSLKRRGQLKNIEQLKNHLFHRHKLFMCSLCLEGRKIFICEQNLYTRAQLDQHISTGDSEVDGSENERGGFMGHPKCEFCQNPFYGDNELYSHMSTEHYRCHICQRKQSVQYVYYRNYDELEIHFRLDHFLCEDEVCLANKFIVFATESEMKRHNTMEHGERMSRSKRNTALQISTSFQYQQSFELDRQQRRRGRLSLASCTSRGTTNADTSHVVSPARQTSSSIHRVTGDASSVRLPVESLEAINSEPLSRFPLAVGQNTHNGLLGESLFPPLPLSGRISQHRSRNDLGWVRGNTMASNLGRQNTVIVLYSSQAPPAANCQPTSSRSTSRLKFSLNSGHASSSSLASSSISRPATINELFSSNHARNLNNVSTETHAIVSANSDNSTSASATNKAKSSSSALKLVDRGPPGNSSDIQATVKQTKKVSCKSQSSPKVEDVHSANKSLVEKIRSGLDYNKDKYSEFKKLSAEFRRGLICGDEYLAHVHRFGLSHLVFELARLCPDVQKQDELLVAYHTSSGQDNHLKESAGNSSSQLKQNKGSNKGKEKCEGDASSYSKTSLVKNSKCSARDLQLGFKPIEEVEVACKDDRCSGKGKSNALAGDELAPSSSDMLPIDSSKQDLQSAGIVSSDIREGEKKQKKKTSKFHRVRLGDNSPSSLLDLNNSDSASNLAKEKSDAKDDPPDRLPFNGVWRNGGGLKLVKNLRTNPLKR